jgi:DnaJ family protein B protein 11
VCEECGNVKYERVTEALSVHVEPGMPDGHEATIFEEGEAAAGGSACLLHRALALPSLAESSSRSLSSLA